MNIAGAVVVLTGASSGIGRATALELARRGARLVLAARGEDALEQVADECRHRGARAIAVPTDVAEPEEVQDLAQRALERFGTIDVWINDAGVALFGSFEDTPLEDQYDLMRTNYFGCVHGARAALPIFRRAGRGILINVSSVYGVCGAPYNSAYAATKFAIRGWSQSLRMELRGTGIDVCTILPAAIDTPLFQNSANYSGRVARPIPPAYPPERAARAIARCIERPRGEVHVGGAGRMLRAFEHFARPLFEAASAAATPRLHFESRPRGATRGNLRDPKLEGARGGWKGGGAGGAVALGLALGAAAYAALRASRAPKDVYRGGIRAQPGQGVESRP